MATLSLSSRLRTPLQPAAMMSSSSSTVSSIGCRRSNSFVGLKGLGIQSPLKSPSASLSSKCPKVSPKQARIVCEAQETAIDIPTVNDTTWQSLVLQVEGPVLVEFWAPWCGPCKMILPILGELAQQYTGKFKCFKLNTDECRSTATKYGIRSIPTTMIFVNGKKKDAIIGAVPKSTLIATIEKFL